jgi:hypothetical protein
MNSCRLLGFVFLFATVSPNASATTSIKTKIIPGGEVAIMVAEAQYYGQAITVFGTGFEIFPHQTCGHAQITLLDADGRSLLLMNVEYQASESTPRSHYRSRFVSYSVTAPFTASVASVFVRHVSNGGCQHAWSLEHALDSLIDRSLLGR